MGSHGYGPSGMSASDCPDSLGDLPSTREALALDHAEC
jgi:hypothetical protein